VDHHAVVALEVGAIRAVFLFSVNPKSVRKIMPLTAFRGTKKIEKRLVVAKAEGRPKKAAAPQG
jgi:hypothetical protein